MLKDLKIVTKAEVGSPEWAAARKGVITATRGANIIASREGHWSYRTELEEWKLLKAELAGEALPDDEDDEDGFRAAAMAWGIESEPLHRAKLSKELGEEVVPFNCIAEDRELPWLRSSLEWYTKQSEMICEGKAPTEYGMDKWSSGSPFMYQVQTHIECHIARRPVGVLSALIPPSVRWERIDHDATSSTFIVDVLSNFWESVQKDMQPNPTGRDYDALRKIAKAAPDKVAHLSNELWMERIEILNLEEQAEKIEARIKTFKAKVIAAMGDASVGVFDDGTGFTLKGQVRNYEAQPARTIVTKPSLRYVKRAL